MCSRRGRMGRRGRGSVLTCREMGRWAVKRLYCRLITNLSRFQRVSRRFFAVHDECCMWTELMLGSNSWFGCCIGALRHSLQDRLSKGSRGQGDEIYLKLRTSTGLFAHYLSHVGLFFTQELHNKVDTWQLLSIRGIWVAWIEHKLAVSLLSWYDHTQAWTQASVM